MNRRTQLSLEPNEVKLVVRALQQLRVHGLTDQDDTDTENLIDYVEAQAKP